MKYKFKDDAKQLLTRAGLRQAELARLAKVGTQDLNRKINNGGPTLEVWARRVARAYGEWAKIDAAAAFDELFEAAGEDSSEMR